MDNELQIKISTVVERLDALTGMVQEMKNLEKASASIGDSVQKGGLFEIGSRLTSAILPAIDAFKGLHDAIAMGGQLSDLSARTGQTVRDLVVLQQAFQNAGIGAGSVGMMMNMLQKSLTGVNEAGEPTAKVFEQIGLSIDSLKGMGGLDQIAALSEAISGVSDPAERARAAMELFGRSGAQMLALLGDTKALETAKAQAGGLAETMERNAAAFDELGDSFEAIAVRAQQFFAGVAEELTPALQQMADAANSADLTQLGKDVGELASALVALKDMAVVVVEVFAVHWVARLIRGRTIVVALGSAIGGLSSLLLEARLASIAFQASLGPLWAGFLGLTLAVQSLTYTYSQFKEVYDSNHMSSDEVDKISEAFAKQNKQAKENITGLERLNREANKLSPEAAKKLADEGMARVAERARQAEEAVKDVARAGDKLKAVQARLDDVEKSAQLAGLNQRRQQAAASGSPMKDSDYERQKADIEQDFAAKKRAKQRAEELADIESAQKKRNDLLEEGTKLAIDLADAARAGNTAESERIRKEWSLVQKETSALNELLKKKRELWDGNEKIRDQEASVANIESDTSVGAAKAREETDAKKEAVDLAIRNAKLSLETEQSLERRIQLLQEINRLEKNAVDLSGDSGDEKGVRKKELDAGSSEKIKNEKEQDARRRDTEQKRRDAETAGDPDKKSRAEELESKYKERLSLRREDVRVRPRVQEEAWKEAETFINEKWGEKGAGEKNTSERSQKAAPAPSENRAGQKNTSERASNEATEAATKAKAEVKKIESDAVQAVNDLGDSMTSAMQSVTSSIASVNNRLQQMQSQMLNLRAS